MIPDDDSTGPVAVASVPVAQTFAGTHVVAPARPARRSPVAARRAPSIAINYTYLRRDIKALAVLAPAMIVLVIAAYIVFH